MSNFDPTDMARRIEQARSQAFEKEAQAAERQRQLAEENKRQNLADRISLKIGREAAGMLINHNIPTKPIWRRVKVGESQPRLKSSLSGNTHSVRDPIYEFQQTSQGWYLMKVSHQYEYGTMPDSTHYTLLTTGEVETFSRTKINNYRQPSGDLVNLEGIIDLSPIAPTSREHFVKSDLFKNAIANLIAGLEPYEHVY